ncbi:uncharacterized protein LOC121837174 [Ixodes scapularis]|uniref:uncharacterized protein LOC121837174 n=1 Tax=Ixodes scapularis TaxID=6945 RepID=UPI001C383C94|nr:uncharacterized protein LOC121837174 [Ixodes scapularis]
MATDGLERSVERALDLTARYCEVTGASVNPAKCNGFWYGSWATKPSLFAGIAWNRNPLTYLGVPLSQIRSNVTYWSSLTTTLKKKTDAWRGRDISIFARSSVCNVFLASKLMYVLQVLHCSRTNIQKIHRIFATFIWCSTWEPIKRDNLFLPLECGGLGLCHIFVRQLVSRFFFFKNVNHDFLRVMLQRRLSGSLNYLIVSTVESSQGTPWGFLKEVVDTLNFLKARFSLEYLFTVSRKALSRSIKESLFPLPLYRTRLTLEPINDVFKRVKKMGVPPSTKTFFFKLHTSTLPFKTYLEEKGIFVPWTVNCRLCNKPETIEHCFIYCNDAFLFWDVLQRTLQKDLVLNDYNLRFLPFSENETVPYDMFALLGLHSLWKCRMIDRHAEKPRTTKSLFLKQVAQVRSVYASKFNQPDWFPMFDKCLGLPNF